ncbi:MAG: SufD family Fe-S cluster assembly protein [Rikenellaceae bacterium]
MQQILQAVNSCGFTTIQQAETLVGVACTAQLSAINPSNFSLRIGEGSTVDLVLLHGDEANASILIHLGRGATLNLTQFLAGRASIDVVVNQSEGSQSEIVAASIVQNQATFNIQLCGINAHSHLSTIQMGADKDNNALKINMRHKSPDCTSRSLSKCVASGESNLSFDGLVYVAHDAQRTAAEQNCRCIELSDSAHIAAQPQLEIYADNVKCSHGATMGQVDTDAIFYMRQRGLSESQARRVQMEGFVLDIVERCNITEVCEALKECVTEKLEQM